MKLIKERLKSILLVALVISSLALTQINLFDGLILSEGMTEAVDVSSTKLSAYINPQSYFVSFGGLSYTRVYDFKMQDNIWGEIRPFILSCFLNYESVTEIGREEYVEAFSDRSLLVRMPLDLTISQYFSIFSDETIKQEIESIYPREYLLREGNVRSLYVFDQVNGKYYLLKHKTVLHDIASLIDIVKSEEWIDYRKISVRFSLESTVDEIYNRLNYELIPYAYDAIVASIKYENEVSLDPERFSEEILNISSAVFGNRMDFVKKLKDVNDSTILMYGYGDKSLTVTHEGNIAYRKKFDQANSEIVDFKGALALATGKLEQFGLMPEGIYLANYTFNASTNSYMFYFNYKLNSYAMAETAVGDHPIIVEVKENQVVSIDKDVKVFAGEIIPPAYQDVERLLTGEDCIAKNDIEISIYYLQDNNILDKTMDTIEYYYPIRSAIASIDLRYIVEADQYMVPVWQIVISGRTYLFNAYSGSLIQTYR